MDRRVKANPVYLFGDQTEDISKLTLYSLPVYAPVSDEGENLHPGSLPKNPTNRDIMQIAVHASDPYEALSIAADAHELPYNAEARLMPRGSQVWLGETFVTV